MARTPSFTHGAGTPRQLSVSFAPDVPNTAPAGTVAGTADALPAGKHQHSLSVPALAAAAATSLAKSTYGSGMQQAEQAQPAGAPLQHPADSLAQGVQQPAPPLAANGAASAHAHNGSASAQDMQQLRWTLERGRTGSAPGAQSLPPLANGSRPSSSSQQQPLNAQAQQSQQSSAQQVAAALSALQAASKRSNSFSSRRLAPLVRRCASVCASMPSAGSLC